MFLIIGCYQEHFLYAVLARDFVFLIPDII